MDFFKGRPEKTSLESDEPQTLSLKVQDSPPR